MRRVLPLGFALFVAGGLLSGFIGLNNLSFAMDQRPSPAAPSTAGASFVPPPESTPRASPTPSATVSPVVNTVRVSVLPSALESGSGWSFLYVIDGNLWVSDGGTQVQLTQGAQISYPTVRDDALAFVERQRNASDIWLATADVPLRPITRNASAIVSQNHWATQLVFVPGRQQMYVLGDFNKDSTGPGNLAIWQLSFQENSVVQITRPPDYAGGDQDITVNPEDPHQIVFTRYAYNSTRLIEQLEWTDVTTNSTVALSQPETPSRQAAYSPDGTSIAFVQVGQGTAQDLWVAQVELASDGPRLKDARLAVSGMVANPVWSPDGSELAYVSLANDRFQVSSVSVTRDPVAGILSFGQPRQVTNGAGVDANSRPVYMTREQSARVRDWLTMTSAHS